MPLHAVAIALGSLLAFYGNELPDPCWSALWPLLICIAYYNPACRFVALAAAAYLWSSAALQFHLQQRLVEEFDYRIATIRGRVVDIPQVDVGRIRLYLEQLEIDDYPGPAPGLARLNWYQDERVPRAGELWQFEARLKQPRGLQNPFGFDYQGWLFTHGITVTGYIRDSARNLKLESASWANVDRWRMSLADALEKHCRDCRRLGLIKGLVLGYRGEISGRQRDLLQRTGTAHLLAISGLHIGLVAFLFYSLGGFGWRFGLYRLTRNRQMLSSVSAMFAAVVYAAMAGFSLPTQRALIMLLVILAALWLKSRVNLLHSASLALILILISDPRAIGSVSLWLSFGALLIIAVTQFRFPAEKRRWRQLLILQFCFALLLLPLGSLIFDQFNPSSLPANLAAIPLVSLIVLPMVLMAAFLALLDSELAGLLLRIADGLLGALLQYLTYLLEHGFDAISTAGFPTALSWLMLGAILILLMPWRLPARRLALTLMFLPLFWQPGSIEDGGFEVLVFDVGMGTSLLLRTRHHQLVYDFGPGRAGIYSAADWALSPALSYYDIDTPDLSIVSHVDQDHSGGLHSMLDRLTPRSILTGTPSEFKSRFDLPHQPRSCHDFPDWRWDGVSFRFLAIGDRVNGSTNNRSCVLLIEGYHRVLLPGDIEMAKEKELVTEYGTQLEADLLLVPHHGSATSSSTVFVNQVNPDVVVYTLSRANRWGFPRDTVIERYDALGSRQFRSDRDGAVIARSTASGFVVRPAVYQSKRIWQRW